MSAENIVELLILLNKHNLSIAVLLDKKSLESI
jgi:hypothetical protein